MRRWGVRIRRWMIGASLVVVVACGNDERVQLPPPTTSPESAIASPTDAPVTAPPTSTAEKVIPESGTPATESVYLEVDVESDAPVFASTVVGSPVRIVLTSDQSRDFYLPHVDRVLSGTVVAFEFVAEEPRTYLVEERSTGVVIVSLEAIVE